MAIGPPHFLRSLGATARGRSVRRLLLIAGCAIGLAGIGALAACAHRQAAPSIPEVAPQPTDTGAVASSPADSSAAREGVQMGYASWYGAAFAGRRTASGERFDPGKMTAAHLTLRFGTWVEVTRVDTRRSVRVRITDRGPFGHADRIIDLSRAAARKIGLLKVGLTRVEVRVVPGP
jgi:rare lipoprotein A